MTEALLRRELVAYSGAMHHAGWVANHDGNLSVRVQPDRLVVTATGMSKKDMTLDDLVVVDGSGKKVAGRRRAFSELVLHLAVYDKRSDVQAVVHAHCPYASAFGSAGIDLPHPFLPEAVVSLGAKIPTVPMTMPGADAVKALTPYVRRCDAVIIAGNGVLAWGPSLELAYLRMELVEHLARIASISQSLGGPKQLPDHIIEALVNKRRSAGLCAPEEGVEEQRDVTADAVNRVIAGMPGVDQATATRLARSVVAGLKQSNG